MGQLFGRKAFRDKKKRVAKTERFHETGVFLVNTNNSVALGQRNKDKMLKR